MRSNIALRPEVEALKAYTPGRSIEEIKDAYGLSQVVKLASNENPLGISPLVAKALERNAASVFRYPRLGYPRLRSALAANQGVEESRLVCGNGSDEIIDLLVRVLVRPGQDSVLAPRPCFSVYGSQTRLAGGDFRQVDLEPGFRLPLNSLADAVDDSTRLIFVTSPDNPSGLATPVDDLAVFAKALPPHILLAVDEAYVHFMDDPEAMSLQSRLAELPNVALLRTFSKAYGLAGLRLGYGILPQAVAEAVRKVQIPFSVNLLAEEAGLAALQDETFLAETLRVTRQGRDYLHAELVRLGCEPVPTQANFIMFTPPLPSGTSAADLCEALLAKGVIVRPLASYGLADKVRVSIGCMDENQTFIAALETCLRKLGGTA